MQKHLPPKHQYEHRLTPTLPKLNCLQKKNCIEEGYLTGGIKLYIILMCIIFRFCCRTDMLIQKALQPIGIYYSSLGPIFVVCGFFPYLWGSNFMNASVSS